VLLGVPGEPFCRIGESIERGCDGRRVLVSTLTNGCRGYFPTRDAFERSSYEAVYSVRHVGLQAFRPSAGDALTEGALALLSECVP
jgi:hypothetical protein